METTDRSRRRFLGSIAAAVASVFFLGRYLAPQGRKAEAPLLTVPKDDIPERGALVFRKARIALVRNGGDLYALSLVCTHLGCTANVSSREIVCPCHGSVFDRSGRVVRGPADKPLRRYRVESRGEDIVVLA
jgi:cytochrome b6-f complex iron-sulfur subunit